MVSELRGKISELWGYKFIIIHRSGVIIQVGTTQSIYEEQLLYRVILSSIYL